MTFFAAIKSHMPRVASLPAPKLPFPRETSGVGHSDCAPSSKSRIHDRARCLRRAEHAGVCK